MTLTVVVYETRLDILSIGTSEVDKPNVSPFAIDLGESPNLGERLAEDT